MADHIDISPPPPPLDSSSMPLNLTLPSLSCAEEGSPPPSPPPLPSDEEKSPSSSSPSEWPATGGMFVLLCGGCDDRRAFDSSYALPMAVVERLVEGQIETTNMPQQPIAADGQKTTAPGCSSAGVGKLCRLGEARYSFALCITPSDAKSSTVISCHHSNRLAVALRTSRDICHVSTRNCYGTSNGGCLRCVDERKLLCVIESVRK
eukprot:GHVS01038372.1.p1 GENE.GHVS01038372.1~~GHVS01038372.1.p1  ORF type:complete len:206 (+),score=53.13 GHVS01038372.1:42-659(+)